MPVAFESPEPLIGDPSLAQVIESSIENALSKVNVSMPGQVVSYDSTKNCASIQPLIKKRYADDTVVALPVINGVPIAFPRTADAWLMMPVKAGDYVTLVFSQRSLEIWLNLGGTVDPMDPRKFSLSDAVAFLGGYPYAAAAVANTDNIVLQNKDTKISLTPNGKFRFEKVGGDEILDLLLQITEELKTFLNTISADTTNTAFGPMPLNAFATYAMLGTQVSLLKSKLSALEG